MLAEYKLMFGSHLSIAGGMHKALLEAERLGFGSVQVFTKDCSNHNGPLLRKVYEHAQSRLH